MKDAPASSGAVLRGQLRVSLVLFAALSLPVGSSIAGCGGSASPAPGSANGDGAAGDSAADRPDSRPGAGGATLAGSGGQVGSTGGRGGPADGGGGSPASKFGAACQQDTDCGGSLTCLQASGQSIATVGGPAGGICSYLCKNIDDTTCDAMNGACIDLGSSAVPALYCLEACETGGDPATKCHGRNDLGCLGGLCFPLCSSDIECPAGRRCAFNLCLDSSRMLTGDPLFSHCTPSAGGGAGSCATPRCLGTTASSPSYCSTECVIGSPTACNYALLSSPLTGDHGFCSPMTSSDTHGDVGLCVQQCDKAADCQDQADPGLRCDLPMPAAAHGLCAWP
jgi:hypothetical protein